MGDQVNLSKKKYIEILAKVVPENNNENIVTMHVDLGTVSEDFYTDFGGMGILNSEDGLFQEFGGEFDGIVTSIEDVGLDMVPDGEPGDDPNDESDNEETNNEKLQINGTENNGYLDTEDLNENGSLDTNNSYFEFSFQMHSMSPHIVSNHDGWILYRIPIDNIDSSQIIHDTSTGLPNMEKLSFAKIWFEPEQTEYPTKIHFANIEVVGNKWEIGSIKDLEDRIISEDELEINNENSQIGISDNKRDMHYKPPSGTTYETDGQKSKEQSLFLSVDNLQPEHQVEIGQEFADKINLLNYGKMKYFIYLEKGEFENDTFDDELSAVIKIGADSTIYYEIEKPIMPNEWETKMKEDWWLDFEIDFSDLTSLKEISFDDSASYTDTDTGVKYSIFKNPNLDIIEEISLGIRNNSSSAFSGTIYFDDIRVKDPYDKIGTAARVTLNSRFADFSTLDVTLENKSDNFMSNNRRSRNSSTDTNKEAIQDLTINNKYYLDKFFPEPWNFDVPLT
ncbi:MAG: hypothetical protein U9N34_10720, partial [Candidatus Cloacimonadota bacterium]|nr:hypothetical protein [Candidatus Cloacimonadota bacterium]